VTALKRRDGGIMLNNSPVTVRAVVHSGDVVELAFDDDFSSDIEPKDIPLSVVYEDEYIIAVNKPAGMPTHPSRGHLDDTLANALMYYMSSHKGDFVFRALNRLDRDTSGIVTVAKDRRSAAALSGKIELKEYTAVLIGEIAESGIIRRNIRRRYESMIEREVCDESDGQYAETKYERVFYGNGMSVVKAYPITGRTHQLRVHFASEGHPIVGDTLYGPREGSLYIDRQALHCSMMVYRLPDGSKATIKAELFDDIKKLIGNVYDEKNLGENL